LLSLRSRQSGFFPLNQELSLARRTYDKESKVAAAAGVTPEFRSLMDSLFSIPPSFPKGFKYIDSFLSPDEEKELYEQIRSLPFHTFNFHGFQAKRKVVSFGYDYNFDKKALIKGKEIPSEFKAFIRKVANQIHLHGKEFAEILVTEYPVGSVINWHRDAFPFDLIAGVSLLSDCIFRLRPYDKLNGDKIISFPVTRGSLYIMEGESRYHWQHSIAPVKKIRYSITLRTLKK
jgi:alkylated DNA repair dioxygenase AlkB